MTNLPIIGGHLPIIEPNRTRIKVKVSPSMLPMFATICPFEIIGSEQSDGGIVVLVLEGRMGDDHVRAQRRVEHRGDRGSERMSYTATLDDEIAFRQMQIKATVWATAYAVWLPIKMAAEPHLDHGDIHTLVCEYADAAISAFLDGEGIVDPLYASIETSPPEGGGGDNVVRLEPK